MQFPDHDSHFFSDRKKYEISMCYNMNNHCDGNHDNLKCILTYSNYIAFSFNPVIMYHKVAAKRYDEKTAGIMNIMEWRKEH